MSSSRATARRLRRGLLAAGIAVGVAAAVVLSDASAELAGADESNDFPFPGADTMALHDGSNSYVTYGATARGKKVPYAVHGSGNDVGTSPTIAGDALPDGGGSWADDHKNIWTPGAFHHTKNGVGRYYLFYTAKRKGQDQHCIGVASSRTPFSGFTTASAPLVCPAKTNRWAIDADVTVGPAGAVWLSWRDGQRAEGAESALSVMMVEFLDNGTVARASEPRVILRSDNLAWAHYRDDAGVTVIENPSVFHHAGSWYLFYSGNSWPTNYYATGIAFCGAKINDDPCTPMPDPRQAWFAYSGPADHLPGDLREHELPGNKRGPGAMDVYRARDGKPWVTWNYLSDAGGRKSRTGKLVITGTGAGAGFTVTPG